MNLTLSLLLILLITLFLAWLTRRAWRARRAFVKWPTSILAGLLTLVGVLLLVVALLGLYQVNRRYPNPVATVEVSNTPAQLAQGKRLAYLCVTCHSSTGDLPLAGASIDITEGTIGTLYPPNLTPGGDLRNWSDGAIVRAIREGLDAEGRTLLLMPSEQYHGMSDDDVLALVAYLRSQPAIDPPTPKHRLNLLGALVVGARLFPISQQAPVEGVVAAPPITATVEHGEYLVTIAGCSSCHGEGLRGGTDQFVPIGPHLPAILGQWDAAQFVTTMCTGIDPYDHPVNPELMPWRNYSAAFSDEELVAIHAYIRTLPL